MDARLPLPADPTSAGVARRFVRATLIDWGISELEEAAALLVSELVTNAVLHARSAAEVALRLDGDRLRVGVSDAVPAGPVRKRYGLEAATGRGMLLVERMARAWGTESSDAGKVVWFELVLGDASPTAESAFSIDVLGLDDDVRAGLDDVPRGDSTHRRRPAIGPRNKVWRSIPPRHRRIGAP
ncbi:MAG: ATP-binding protein [Actinobacteria bacterium]|nr:ATP-binding protein [Actinomycetota bacterium]